MPDLRQHNQNNACVRLFQHYTVGAKGKPVNKVNDPRRIMCHLYEQLNQDAATSDTLAAAAQSALGTGAASSTPPVCMHHAWSTRGATSPRLWLIMSTVQRCFSVPAPSADAGSTQQLAVCHAQQGAVQGVLCPAVCRGLWGHMRWLHGFKLACQAQGMSSISAPGSRGSRSTAAMSEQARQSSPDRGSSSSSSLGLRARATAREARLCKPPDRACRGVSRGMPCAHLAHSYGPEGSSHVRCSQQPTKARQVPPHRRRGTANDMTVSGAHMLHLEIRSRHSLTDSPCLACRALYKHGQQP